eukprot:CAMPEP_0173216888 /NCGR_PEP_ID=MMETSP1142-20121109/175_1 /TAXON_ID=483371 /ORGANISM="non described non described, Strain CCMP2298" /LENGTH=101 /DNA_ID=CAMNT_0014144377 /DNA_START=484 /DNA_END=790 /DNA_ORIENTATION=+
MADSSQSPTTNLELIGVPDDFNVLADFGDGAGAALGDLTFVRLDDLVELSTLGHVHMAIIELSSHTGNELFEYSVDSTPSDVEELVQIVRTRVPGEDTEAN